MCSNHERTNPKIWLLHHSCTSFFYCTPNLSCTIFTLNESPSVRKLARPQFVLADSGPVMAQITEQFKGLRVSDKPFPQRYYTGIWINALTCPAWSGIEWNPIFVKNYPINIARKLGWAQKEKRSPIGHYFFPCSSKHSRCENFPSSLKAQLSKILQLVIKSQTFQFSSMRGKMDSNYSTESKGL